MAMLPLAGPQDLSFRRVIFHGNNRMMILACLLLGANLLAFILVFASQRISPSVCGGCGHALAANQDRRCEHCGADLLVVGITAGSVMRPPRRGLLVLLVGILVLSLLPLQVYILVRELDYRHEHGPAYTTRGAKYGFDTSAPLTNRETMIRVVLTEFTASGSPMNPGYNIVTDAEIELAMFPPELGKGSPLKSVVYRGGKQAYEYPRRQDVLAWFKQEQLFLDTPEGKEALERNVDHIHEQMAMFQNGSLTTGSDMNRLYGQSGRGRMPQSRWVAMAGWSILFFVEFLLLAIGLLVVIRFTRRELPS